MRGRVLLLVVLCAGCARHPLQGAAASPALSFPKDHGAHLAQTEWWHFHGHLTDGAGRRHDFFLAFVRWHTDEDGYLGLPLRLAVDPGQLAMFSVTDRARGRHRSRDKYAYPDVWAASAREGRLSLRHDDWWAEGTPEGFRLRGSTQGAELELSLEATKPVVAEGDQGRFVRSGTDSSFYTLPRLSAQGVLRLDGEELAVSGEAWFKHQWGYLYGPEVVGWVWFGVQLEGGKELQVGLVKDRGWYQADGSFAEVVEADGRATPLKLDELGVAQTGEVWTGPRTGVRWPVGWRLELPEREGFLELTTSVPGQELDVFPAPMWAGALEVSGRFDGQPTNGQAMAEVFGLEEPFLRRFFRSGQPKERRR